MTSAFRWIRRLGLACLFGSASATMAQVPQAYPVGSDAVDPPGRVARLADVSGSVWLLNPDSGEWTSALRNQPLTTGDRLATDPGGRAELRVGSTTLRLDGDSELEMMRLDDEHIDVQLHQGSLAARLRNADALRDFELRTVEGRFVAQRTGRYRFDRHGEGSAVTVYGGQALYEGPGSALTVTSRQRADFRLDRNGVAQYAIGEPVADSFAAWGADRDRDDDRYAAGRPGEPIGERLASSRYVSPEMTGAEDLDRNGSWDNDPEYGALWIPRSVPVGWAPYAAGRWAWVRPWGWTWIDDAPWGFAPFHYGRWVQRRNVWCWAPGSYVARPVYAPALVGWVGASPRPGVNISISIGSGPAVGWFPLAPREVFVPGYRVTPRYVREVNVTHVRNITNITTIINNPQGAVSGFDYRNRRDPRAVTMVPESVLRQRQPVGGAAAAWRREAGERGGRDLAPTTAMVAPPAAEPSRSPGRAHEPGRPEWAAGRFPRGERPDAAPLPRGADAPARPAPAPAVAAPTAPVAVPPRGAIDPTRRDGRRGFEQPRADERQDDRRDDRRDDRPPVAAPRAPAPAPAPVAVPATPAPVRGTLPAAPAPQAAVPPAAPPVVAPLGQPVPRGNPNNRSADGDAARIAQPAQSPQAPQAAPRSQPQPQTPPPAQPQPQAQPPRPAPAPDARREPPRERAPEKAVDKPSEKPAERPADSRPGFEERRGRGEGEKRERGDRVERNQAN